MKSFWAVLKKEILHMLRDRGTLQFALILPIFELILFGLLDMNVKHVPTVVFDQSRTRESRELIQELGNTSYFDVVNNVTSRNGLHREIVAGHASVGIEIPPDYGRKRLAGQPADFLVLIDGSDSNVSSQTLAAANGLALSKSLRQMSEDRLPVEAHPLLLFNPDSRSANLLIPGLVAILLTFSGTLLAAFAIVRERERGTLEQLMVTPVSPVGVVIGKLIPYMILSLIQLVLILLLMVFAFSVPIHGNVALLMALSIVYLFSLLSLGLVVSSRAQTQMEAIQRAQAVLLPSIFLSGYVFPLASLPVWLQAISKILPATHFIAISRGIIIRGASFADLWPNVAALLGIAVLLLAFSARAFRKTIS